MLSVLIPDHNENGIKEFVQEVEALNIADEIIVCKDSESKGKGWALREAILQSKGDLIAFIDGDNEIPPRMFYRLLPFLEDFDVVVGSKRITKSPLRRKIMTHVTRVWFRFLFGIQVDSQTGIKIFRRSVFDFSDGCWKSNGFCFDLEIIAKLQKNGISMVEVPIECEIRRQLSFKTIFRITWESLCLKWRLICSSL